MSKWLQKKLLDIMTKIPTKTGGASPSSSSFQNLTFRKNVSALPFCTSPRSALINLTKMKGLSWDVQTPFFFSHIIYKKKGKRENE